MSDTTDFPKQGDDKAVSLRNSEYARFDLAFAQDLKDNHPKVWRKGGNIKGNAQFAILSRIAKQGGSPKTPAEEKAIRLREAWAARHYQNKRVPGVVAQIKWLVVGALGERRMKDLMNDEKEKRRDDTGIHPARDEAAESPGDNGHDAPDGVLMRAAVVRAVRREARPTETNPKRSVVTVDFIASTEDIDSHDSILVCDWDQDGRLSRYLSNPVLLWQHGRAPEQIPAIGVCENVRVEGRQLLATAVFDDSTEFDRAVAEKYEKSILRGFSVRFRSEYAEVRMIDGREIVEFSGNELLEISGVNIPSNAVTLTTQRDVVTTAREMARAVGGRVQVRDVVDRMRAHTIIQERTEPAPVAAPTPAASAVPGETMTIKTIEIGERDVRSEKGGMHAKMSCPHCDKEIDLSMKSMPMSPEKAAEMEQTRASLTEKERLLDAEVRRAQGLEDKLAVASARFATMLVDTAESELKARSGKKFEPHEYDTEMDLARMFLGDMTPDPDAPKDDKGNPTRTVGQKKFAARLATLDKRRDIGLLDGPITTTTPLPSTDETVRDAAAGTPKPRGAETRAGDGLAALLDAQAAN